MPIDSLVPTFYTDTFNTQSGEKYLNYNYFSIGVRNKGTGDVKIQISKYNPLSYVIIPANSFSEIAAVGNYIRFEYLSGLSYDLEITYLTYSTDSFNVPRFPNLIIQGNNSVDYVYNPLNMDGFFTETYNFGQTSYVPYNSESIVEVDYYFNGNKLPASSQNFYNTFFTNFIQTFITSIYPFSDVNDVLQVLPGGQEAEIVSRVKNFFTQIDRPLNDEYVGGWARLTSFDRALSLLKYNLNTGDKIQFPFYLMGFILKNNGTSNATVLYRKDTDPPVTVNLTPGQQEFIQFQETNIIEVTSGSNVEVSFTGYLVKLMEFAPIINIFYPIGFDESTGKPAQAFTTFVNWLNDFENNLVNARFTGRVVKYKWVQHRAQEHFIYDADYWNVVFSEKKIPLPFEEIRPFLRDWYAYNKFEIDLLRRIIDQNYAAITVVPQNLKDVISDDNITKILHADFSSFTAGPTRQAAKKEFLIQLLLQDYLGPYSRGGLTNGVGIYN